ncbi:MAG: tetratricopeptide repeat protein [Rhodospirillales bacterium]
MTDADQLLTQAITALRETRIDDAADALDAVLALIPGHSQANAFRGTIHLSQGNAVAALPYFRLAAEAHTADPGFNQNYAIALLAGGDAAAAEETARRALTNAPGNPVVLLTLARSLRAQGHEREALDLLHQVSTTQPSLAVCNEEGLCLMELNRPKEAEAAFTRAAEFDETAYEPWHNMGNAALDQHRPDDAIAAFDRAIQRAPDHAPSHVHRAQALLLSGRYSEGWESYEWRWKLPNRLTLRDDLSTPLWDGRPFTGKRLLIYAEQGFGDTLQFARFLPLAQARGGTVIVDVPAALYRLFASQNAGYEVSRQDEKVPAHDLRLPMMSLPRALDMTLDNLLAPQSCLSVAEGDGKWLKRLADAPGLKVGLAWRAFAERRGSAFRTVPLTALAQLFDITGVSWFSLQKETSRDDPPAPANLRDMSEHLTDFWETAAFIRQLDLVITVDTAVAHLAGALGRPVWIMLPYGNDWRWLTARSDSPWYPTARLYRQNIERTWNSVVEAVARDLADALS